MGKFADYETYACVYESGSFTAAARRLHVGSRRSRKRWRGWNSSSAHA